MKHILNSLLVISAFWCFSAIADSFTLPNGKVIEDPYVMSESPDGLEIGHKKGILFIKFTDLPVKVQKKYNYDPAKAAQYEADQVARQEKRKLEQQKKKAEQVKIFNDEQKKIESSTIDELDVKIQKSENRISFLQAEIPKLEARYSTLLDKSVNMKLDNAVMNQTATGDNWNGGFITSGGGQKSIKKAAIKQITDEAAETKNTLNAYKKELQSTQDSLIVMKKNYELMKAQPAPESKQ